MARGLLGAIEGARLNRPCDGRWFSLLSASFLSRSVSQPTLLPTSEYSWWLRCAFGLLGAVLITLLCVAAWLRPEPRGRGTHQQLGLPPCTFVMLWNKPCPTCGMTTSWSNLMRGRFREALAANVGGTLLGVIAVVAGPWLLCSAVRGRTVGRLPNDWILTATALVLMFVTLADWGLRLWNGF